MYIYTIFALLEILEIVLHMSFLIFYFQCTRHARQEMSYKDIFCLLILY